MPSSFGVSTVCLLATLAAHVIADDGAYFIAGSGMSVVLERVDPLLSPGKPSNHVHSVLGGNAFAATMDFAQTQTSDCSTLPIKADKSNYWMPALYYKSPHNSSFIRVPEKPDNKIYYKYGGPNNVIDTERSEFPQDFRMMAGNAMLRADDGSFGDDGNQLNWYCHGPPDIRATGFPKFTSCSYGLAATMRFPSCWNGQPFDPAKPLAHMAFPGQQIGLAGCTAPHNVKRFPEIMIEYWLDVSSFDGDYGIDDNPWVLAPGDNTGFAMHIDFINGWEPGKLQAAMKTCYIGNGGFLDSDECFGAGALYDDATASNCRAKNIVDEDVGLTGGESSKDDSKTYGGVLPHLPGCNPIQPGPQLATAQTNCPYSWPQTLSDGSGGSGASVDPSPTTMATSVSSTAVAQQSSASVVDQQLTNTPVMPIVATTSQSTTTTSSPAESATSTGSTGSDSGASHMTAADGSTWQLMGCFTDQLNPVRSLGTNPEWWGEDISSSNCVDHCSKIGMSMSGTENGGQCFCGTSLVNSKQVDISKCNTPCNGDASQTCGGSGTLSVYKKSGGQTKRTHRHLARHLEAVS